MTTRLIPAAEVGNLLVLMSSEPILHTELDALPIFDREMLSESSLGDEDFARQLIEVFESTIGDYVRAYDAALKASADQEAHRAMHSVKGSSRALGMMRLGQMSEILEKWVKLGCPGAAPISVDEYREEVDRTIKVVRESLQ